MEQLTTTDIDGLKAAEKALSEGGSARKGKKAGRHGGKGRKHRHRKHKDGCEWGPDGGQLGLFLIAGGAFALLAALGVPLNTWALFLLVPGLVGVSHSAGLARHFPQAGWTAWPLMSAVSMATAGLAWLLGLSWSGLAGLSLCGLGASLLWLARLRSRRQTVK